MAARVANNMDQTYGELSSYVGEDFPKKERANGSGELDLFQVSDLFSDLAWYFLFLSSLQVTIVPQWVPGNLMLVPMGLATY